jgi:hypothetical protein
VILVAELMELVFRNQLRALLLQDSQIGRRQNMQVLSLVLLFIANLFHTLLNHLFSLQEHREVILNVHEDDESVANLDVVLGTEAGDDSSGDFEVPLVAQMAEVLEINLIVGV